MMPPVRWKLSTVITVWLLQVFYVQAQFRKDEISVDGWRPILGTRKPNNYYEAYSPTPTPKDYYKYESFSTASPTVASPTVTSGPTIKPYFRESHKPALITGRKIPHQKHYHSDPYFALPAHNNRGPQVPISSVVHTRPGQIGHIKQLATTGKPYIQLNSQIGHIKQQPTTSKPFMTPTTSKRNVKPTYMHMQASTSGYRDDIFTASATSGAYYSHKQGPNNIRTRETVDLGLPGQNHYSFNQPHAHIEFNRFPLPSTSASLYQQYNNPSVAPQTFGKPPQNNDINYQIQQNEEFTRNLIASGQLYKNKEYVNRVRPENVVLQVPPPFQYQQQTNEPQVQVQVTKEKLQEFHNNIPPNFHGQYIEYDFSNRRKPTENPNPTYEVTENNNWHEPPSHQPKRGRRPVNRRPDVNEVIPPSQQKRRPVHENNFPVFLPTPYKPEKQAVEPTSPTQEEVSTVFTKLSKLQREKQLVTADPSTFSVKEVSTHYPILGKPIFAEVYPAKELSNEITTHYEEEVPTTREPQRIKPHRRRRPDNRRTTSTTTTTTTPPEPTEIVYQQEENSQSSETERPLRIRRPNRFRTTTPSSSEEFVVKSNRGRNRYRVQNLEDTNLPRRQRPTRLRDTTSLPDNHKSVEEYYREPSHEESQEAASEKSEEIEQTPEKELPGRHYELTKEVPQETIKPFIIITTTEKLPTTNLVVPEEENEVTSLPNFEETTTTPAPTTTVTTPHRIKTRPIKFDNSNRPRFSVKDYRQKLNLHSSTTTAQPHRTTDTVRIRNRLRRPIATTPATNEDETETSRPKFIPRDARHGVTTDATNSIITEKNVKSINTRLRPFGKYKSTTTTTTSTPKVSIKSNLFNRKRPPMLSLRNKIFNKYHRNTTETTTEKIVNEEEEKGSTVEYEPEDEVEPTTESSWTNDKSTEKEEEIETTTVADISKIDPYFYTQRVSDLTSSSKNDYNTPGLFKSVPPTSRRIPNSFTISTDDPILPIEAFFSNIKEKNREQDF